MKSKLPYLFPKNTHTQTPLWYQRLLLEGTRNKPPIGYFTIFRESIDLLRDLEANGYKLPFDVYPDISIGSSWANYLHTNGIRPESVGLAYQHYYPNGQTKNAVAYTNQFLPEFRQWFHHLYLAKVPLAIHSLEELLELLPGTISCSSTTFQ